MLLPWINKDVDTVRDALWYILQSPPPKNTDSLIPLTLKLKRPPALLRAELLWNSPPPRLFALLIAINKYKDRNVRDLRGCVADADAMHAFLEQTLCVPSSRIQTLHDEHATREQIIRHMHDLAFNPELDIKHGDPIVIFYAGHGSELSLPGNGKAKIQMLLPHDFMSQTTDDENSQGIPDITLGDLLSDIAAAKGDNITVILDTCHSGSGTRDETSNLDSMTRGIELPESYVILPTIDNGVLSRRSGESTKRFKNASLASHVLLSACMENQTAKENHGRGVFSRELLQLLRTAGADKLTYKETIDRLPYLPMQNPQCEGLHNLRVLFDGKVPTIGRVLYPVYMRGEDVVVQAGEAHGVTRGAHFNLFPDQSPDSPAFDGFIVVQTGAFESVVRREAGSPDFIVPAATYGKSVPTAWALQTLVGEREDIRVFIPLKDLFIDLFHYIAVQMQETGKETMRIRLVEENEPADLILHVEDEQSEKNQWVSFEPMDSTCQGYGLKRMPHSAPLEATPLYFILASAARFYWHLRRSSTQAMLARSVTVECTKLGEDASKPYAYTTNPILVPHGDNLITGGKIVIDLDNRPSVEHGFTITNHSTYPLYAAFFYFDMSDLSISPLYLPPHAKNLEVSPSIPANGGSLSIGYGAGGWPPATFKLPTFPTGRLADVDIGVLKLFISTQYVDYSYMAQESPFEDFRGLVRVPERKPEMWDTVQIGVVLRRESTDSI